MPFKKEAINRLRSDLMMEPQLQYASIAEHVRKMAETDQTSPFHREGDVLTHTYMVVEELDKVLEAAEGGADYKNNPMHRALLFAAWFHDFGKVTTVEWNEKKQRNTFNRHEDESAFQWRELYLQFEIDPIFGEHVFELIRNHAAPTNYAKTKALDKTYIRLADRVPPYQLYLLEQADMRGRIADDQQAVLNLLEGFYEKCEQLSVLKENRFKTFRFYSLSELAYIVKNKRCLLLPIGVPGCGKSHLLEQLLQFHPDTTVVCPDQIRTELYGEDWHQKYEEVDQGKVFGVANHRLKLAMQKEGDCLIYFDAQNASIKDRKTKIVMATKYNLAVVCFWFRTKLETTLRQNSEREHTVPEKYIRRALGWLQLPIASEADYVVALSPR